MNKDNSNAIISLLSSSRDCTFDTLRIQREAPLTTLLPIAPPIRHRRNLPTPKTQKNQQHIQIETSIKRRRQYIVILGPELITISECPVHDDETANELRRVACADISVEV